MDVRFTEEQELLRESARDLLARECPMSLVREVSDDGKALPEALWQRLAELGWLGLVLPEAHGGAGLGPIELAILMEETGRVLLPGAFLPTLVLGGLGLKLAGSDEQRARLLPGIADGSLRATLAFHEEACARDATASVAARREGDALVLDGDARFVLEADTADLLLVPARLADGSLVLTCVDRLSPGVLIRRLAYADMTRSVCDLSFRELRVPREALLAESESAEAALAQLLDHARVALCAEMCGVAARVLELSVAYAKTRQQFGRPIGSFQAIQHRCADMLLDVESMRSATWYAAWTLASDAPDAHRAACMAKSHCADAGPRVAGAGIQIHGGQGFTWEQDLHLYYKRAKADEQQLGDAAWHRELVARELLDS